MGNINVNEATKKNERNIIIIGVIGIVIALAMLGLSIWFLIAQLDIANQTNSSVGIAIGGFIGMIVGIALFITVGILIYCNAIRNVHIRNTIKHIRPLSNIFPWFYIASFNSKYFFCIFTVFF